MGVALDVVLGGVHGGCMGGACVASRLLEYVRPMQRKRALDLLGSAPEHGRPRRPRLPAPTASPASPALSPHPAGATSAAIKKSNSGLTQKLSGFASFAALALGATMLLSGLGIDLPISLPALPFFGGHSH